MEEKVEIQSQWCSYSLTSNYNTLLSQTKDVHKYKELVA